MRLPPSHPSRQRLLAFLDEGSFEEIGSEVVPVDRLKFKDSKKIVRSRLQAAQNLPASSKR